MQKEFSLEAILSITTGISCTADFDKVYELVWFVYNDSLINSLGLGIIKDELKEHLLNIHPELRDISYSKKSLKNKSYLTNWLEKQKETFGEILPVSRLGESLEESYIAKDKKDDFINIEVKQNGENKKKIQKIKKI